MGKKEIVKSLEKALNSFSKVYPVLVANTELKSKVGNIIIPKTKEGNILTEEMFYSHLGSEVITYKKLGEELDVSLGDIKDSFNEKYSNIFQVNNVWKKETRNNQKALEILDMITTADGWKVDSSSWYSNISDTIIQSIDTFGVNGYSDLKKPYYKKFNIVKDSLIVDSMKSSPLLKFLNLYHLVINELIEIDGSSEDLATDRLEYYLSDHSVELVIKFSVIGPTHHKYKGQSKIQITYGVVVPSRLTTLNDNLVTTSFEIPVDDFNRISNMIIARKKLVRGFAKTGINLVPLNSLKKEKILWFNDRPNFYYGKLPDEEISLINAIIGETLFGLRKTIKIRWSLLEAIFNQVLDYYSNFNGLDNYVPSGPDTSKFTATKSGSVKFCKDFRMGETYYTRGTYFKYGLQVGGNYNYGSPKKVMLYILNYIEKYYGLPNYSDGSRVTISVGCGTNYSAIGIG